MGRFIVERIESETESQQAFCCMVEVPSPWPRALCACRDWVAENLGRYVEGYHLHDDDGTVVGHLYYAPSEQALFPYEVEAGATVMYCDWVQRRHQGQGLGRRLFGTFMADVKARGSKGVLMEATDLEGQMHYRHYLSRGFEIIGDFGHKKLLYLPLSQSKIQAQRLQSRIQPQQAKPVEVLVISGYMCPFDGAAQLTLLDVLQEFGDRVVLRQEWLTPESLRRYGVANGVFINGRQRLIETATEEAIRQAIAEELEEL